MSGKARISSSSYSMAAGFRPATIPQKTQSAMGRDGDSVQTGRRGLRELQEHADQIRVELAGPGSLAEALQRDFFVERRLVRALGAQGVVDVDNRHEARE